MRKSSHKREREWSQLGMSLPEMMNYLLSIIEEVLISIFVCIGMPFGLLFNLQLFDFVFNVALLWPLITIIVLYRIWLSHISNSSNLSVGKCFNGNRRSELDRLRGLLSSNGLIHGNNQLFIAQKRSKSFYYYTRFTTFILRWIMYQL